jgi:hypothetical protein
MRRDKKKKWDKWKWQMGQIPTHTQEFANGVVKFFFKKI